MWMPFVKGLEIGGWCRDGLAKPYKMDAPKEFSLSRIVLHPRSREAHSVFGTGALLLCQPSEMVRVGRSCTLVAARKHPTRSEQGRLLLTMHPENWLPDLDSHQDKRFNRPTCYFDTTWQK